MCKGCAVDKYSKTKFSSNDSRSKGISDLVHSNICGTMLVSSLAGYNYYVTFIDDFSKRMWIYFMKTKDEIFSQFREFKALMENQTEKIKVMGTTNEGEYTSNKFKDLCKEAGITKELTVPYKLSKQ